MEINTKIDPQNYGNFFNNQSSHTYNTDSMQITIKAKEKDIPEYKHELGGSTTDACC